MSIPRNSKLPIVQTAYELTFLIADTSSNFPKTAKYCYGDRLQHLSLDLLSQILDTNASFEKSKEIPKIIEIIKKINIICELCFDLKIISIKKYSEIVMLSGSINKQSIGWLKSSTK